MESATSYQSDSSTEQDHNQETQPKFDTTMESPIPVNNDNSPAVARRRSKSKKRLFNGKSASNSKFQPQQSHVMTSNQKRLSLPIETIIEDVMEDPEHFVDEVNQSIKENDEKILSAIRDISLKQATNNRSKKSNSKKWAQSLKQKRNQDEMPVDRSLAEVAESIGEDKSSIPSKQPANDISAKDAVRELNQITGVTSVVQSTRSLKSMESESESGQDEEPYRILDKDTILQQIVKESSVASLTREELKFIESKLVSSNPDHQRIKTLINLRKAREFLDTRIRALEGSLAEGAEEILEDKPTIITLGGIANMLRYGGRLIKFKRSTNLPVKLPDSMVYWNRLETRVTSTRLLKPQHLIDFYKLEVPLHRDELATAKVCRGHFPYIEGSEIWEDKSQEDFQNESERKIYLQTKWAKSLDKRECEGYIRFDRVRCKDVFFNSRFESGNLRQVYRVNKDDDYEEVEVEEEEIPDYLPEEEIESLTAQRKERHEIVQKALKEKHETEDLEEEKVMKEWLTACDVKAVRRTEKERKLHELQAQGLTEEHVRAQLDDLYPDLVDDDLENEQDTVELIDDEQQDENSPQLFNDKIEKFEKANEKVEKTEIMKPAVEKIVKTSVEDTEELKREKAIRSELQRKWQKKKEKQQKKQIGPDAEYNLYLQDDTQADSATYQWYYFSVMNIKSETKVRINIVNLSKPNALYARGMQPFVYSFNRFKTKGIGWTRGGENIRFYANENIARYNKMTLDAEWLADGTPNLQNDQLKKLHTLQFDYKFESNYDTVFFAHFVPYTYTDLIHYLSKLEYSEDNQKRMRLDYICNSLGQAPVYGLTITNDIQTAYVSRNKEILKFQNYEYQKHKVKSKKIKKLTKPEDDSQLKQVNEGSVQQEEAADKLYKKHIFITSRVHPGESQASYMVEGLINFLLSDHPEADEIRSKFVFKIIPMLNPDGVIFGNYRNSLLGVDLNRRWKKPSRYLHPEVYYTKQIIKYFDLKSKQPDCDSGGVVMFADFHGHSKNMDAFMYSCIDLTDLPQSHFNNMAVRTIPAALDRFIPIFNIRECKFALEREKENTARIVLYKELGLLSSYTFEATFFGSDYLRHLKYTLNMYHSKETVAEINEKYGYVLGRKDVQVTTKHMRLLGEDLSKAINFASKKRPLVYYWFRLPPKVLVEIINPFEKEKEEVDLTLLELEKAWLPTGKVQQDSHLEIGQKFEQLNRIKQERREEEMRLKEETLDDIAAKRRMEAQKKEAINKKRQAEKTKKVQQLKLELMTGKKKAPKETFNNDLDGIKSPKKLRKSPVKKAGRQQEDDADVKQKQKRNISTEFKDYVAVHQAKELSSGRQFDNNKNIPVLNQKADLTERKSSATNINDKALEGEITPVNVTKIKIVLDQPSRLSTETEEDEELDSISMPGRHQLPYLDNAAPTQEANKFQLNFKTTQESAQTPKSSQNSSPRQSQDKRDNRLTEELTMKAHKHPILPLIEDRKTPKMAKINEQMTREKRLRHIADLVEQDEYHRSLLISPQIKTPKRQQIVFNEQKPKDKNKMLKEHTQERAFSATLKLKKQSIFCSSNLSLIESGDEQLEIEPLPKQYLNVSLNQIQNQARAEKNPVINTDQSAQQLISASVQTLGVQTMNQVTPLPLDEKAFNEMILYNSQLSVDPLVFSSQKLDIVSRLKLKTLEKEQHQYQSARKHQKKQVFAPANAVYSQQSLLQHPELLKKEGIHFTVGNPLNLNTKQLLPNESLSKPPEISARYDPTPINQPVTQRLPVISTSRRDNQLINSLLSIDLQDVQSDRRNFPLNKNSQVFQSGQSQFESYIQNERKRSNAQPAQDLVANIPKHIRGQSQDLSFSYDIQPTINKGIQQSNHKNDLPSSQRFQAKYSSQQKPLKAPRITRVILKPLESIAMPGSLEVNLDDSDLREIKLKRDQIKKSPRTSPELQTHLMKTIAVQQMVGTVGIKDNRLCIFKGKQ